MNCPTPSVLSVADALRTKAYIADQSLATAVFLALRLNRHRGDPQLLGQEMDRLQRSCHRLIWLNPLLGSPSYEPLTRGIQAAPPHTDDFLSVHNSDQPGAVGARAGRGTVVTERESSRKQELP